MSPRVTEGAMSTLASVTAAAAGPLLASQVPPSNPFVVQPPASQDASQAVQAAAAPQPVVRAQAPGPDARSPGQPGSSDANGYTADGSATASGGRSLIDIKV
jgi:hypothetical protein